MERSYNLALQPQRPGELGHEFVVSISRDHATEIEHFASTAGLPTPLWSTLGVEAARSVALVSAVLGTHMADVEKTLSAAAVDARQLRRRSRLSDYAEALRAAAPREPAIVSGRLALRPGLASATAWDAEAEAADMAVTDWILQALARTPDGFVFWEAAAAEEGRSLPEWALLQAARRLRSASTPAQTA